MEKRKYKTRTIWSEANERAFVKIWKKRNPELKFLRKNRRVMAEMADELANVEDGIRVSIDEMKNKVSNFKNRYKKERLQIIQDSSHVKSDLYDEVHSIMTSDKFSSENLHDNLMEDYISSEDFPSAQSFEFTSDALNSEEISSMPCPQLLKTLSRSASPDSDDSRPAFLPAPVIKNKTSFQQKLMKNMETANSAIQNLVLEMHESNRIEKNKADQIERYVCCMEQLTATMTDFFASQKKK